MAFNENEPIGENARITTEPIPGSRKVYVEGVMHPDIRVPFRRIELSEAAKASKTEPLSHLSVCCRMTPQWRSKKRDLRCCSSELISSR